MPLPAQRFIGELIATGYMLPLWKGAEVAGGAMLLANLWPSLGLLLLAPIIVNIFFFHLVLDPKDFYIGIVLVALALVTAWGRRVAYWPLLKPDT